MAPTYYPGQGMLFDGIVGLIVILVYFLCVLIHEGGHKLFSILFNRFYDGNQLTIWGGVPKESDSFTLSDPRDRIVRMGGPIFNLLIGVVLHHLDSSIRQHPDPLSEDIAPFIFFAMKTNLFLAFINLLPILPFDMGALFFLGKNKAGQDGLSRWAAQGGLGFAWILTLVGLALATRGSLISGFGMIFLGVHLARSVVVWKGRLGLVSFLKAQDISTLVERDGYGLKMSESLESAYLNHFYPSGRGRLPVCSDDGVFQGVLDWSELKKVPSLLRADRSVGSLSLSNGMRDKVLLDSNSWRILFDAIERGANQLFVLESDQYKGMIFPLRLLEQYRMSTSLGPPDRGERASKMKEGPEDPPPNPPEPL
ncbi:MAG: zinc metalloprotease [Leptospirales bacterium]